MPSSGQSDGLGTCCVVGLPLTAALLPLLSGVATALVMCCAEKKRRKWKKIEIKKELAQEQPVYEFPEIIEQRSEEMDITANNCYITQHN